jgi:flagellar biosynthetic protein FlhB
VADNHDKTLAPTAKRRREARERGQIAVSRDLTTAAASLAATAVLINSGPRLLARLTSAVSEGILRMGDASRADVTPEMLTPLVMAGGMLVALTAGYVAVAAGAGGVFTSLVQTRGNFSTKALQIKWDRLNPANGFSKLAPSRAGVDTIKTLVTGSILAVLAWRVGRSAMGDSGRLVWTGPALSAGMGWDEVLSLLLQAGVALLAVGAADYAIQRWRITKSLKMSHQEVREEHKQEEVRPEVKAKIRRAQRDMLRSRMLKAVPKATVVLTNPTHFAVALEYDRTKSPAPMVVAKGADLMAAKIREIAREHSVPIIENPPLTRALYKECEIGETIPGPLFGAVAEVLAYLIRIKQLVL